MPSNSNNSKTDNSFNLLNLTPSTRLLHRLDHDMPSHYERTSRSRSRSRPSNPTRSAIRVASPPSDRKSPSSISRHPRSISNLSSDPVHQPSRPGKGKRLQNWDSSFCSHGSFVAYWFLKASPSTIASLRCPTSCKSRSFAPSRSATFSTSDSPLNHGTHSSPSTRVP